MLTKLTDRLKVLLTEVPVVFWALLFPVSCVSLVAPSYGLW